METERQIAVRIVLSAVPEFLSVVQGLADRMAEQRQFSESQRLQLRQGLHQACRHVMREGARSTDASSTGGEEEAAEMRLDLSGYADRMEMVLECDTSLETSETELFLLNEFFDRVVLEEGSQGQARLTLVQYPGAIGGPS